MMRQLLRRPTIFREASVLAGVFLLLCAVLWAIVSMPHAAAADTGSGERLVTIHDRGNEKVVLTRATTIGAALKDAGMTLDEHDRTEPRVATPLEANNYTVNVYRARPVIVVDGALRQKVMTAHQTARGIAAEAGLILHDEDETALKPSDDIVSDGAGQKMVVTRATEFTLELYGQKTTAYTQETTVGDMMKRKKITLDKDDTLSVPAATPMTAGMTVAIWRNGVQTQTKEEEVAFNTRQVQAPDQPVGYKQVQTAGRNGKKMVTYQIEMRNGIEVSRAAIQSVVTEQPVQQVEIVGTKLTNTFSGSFAEALARLRSCEGSYTSNTGNGYYGAYQYDVRTWGNYKGYANASLAPPAVQDEKAWLTYQSRGWQPWPSCSRSKGLQDIYR